MPMFHYPNPRCLASQLSDFPASNGPSDRRSRSSYRAICQNARSSASANAHLQFPPDGRAGAAPSRKSRHHSAKPCLTWLEPNTRRGRTVTHPGSSCSWLAASVAILELKRSKVSERGLYRASRQKTPAASAGRNVRERPRSENLHKAAVAGRLMCGPSTPAADQRQARPAPPFSAKRRHDMARFFTQFYCTRFQTMTPVHEPSGATFFSSSPVMATDRF